jgi:hypothetical protein
LNLFAAEVVPMVAGVFTETEGGLALFVEKALPRISSALEGESGWIQCRI